jgi:hypothetical protein
MGTITLNLPDAIVELYPKVGDKVFLSALRESIKQHIKDEHDNLKTIKKRIKFYEKKYTTNFEIFEKNLPPDGDYQIHEDYGEWSYLVDVAKAIEKDIANYQKLNGKVQ